MSTLHITPQDVPQGERPRDRAAWAAVKALHEAGRLVLLAWQAPSGQTRYSLHLRGTEANPIPLAHLAYDEEGGLYDCRQGRPGDW